MDIARCAAIGPLQRDCTGFFVGDLYRFPWPCLAETGKLRAICDSLLSSVQTELLNLDNGLDKVYYYYGYNSQNTSFF